jgi:hypothetical protein
MDGITLACPRKSAKWDLSGSHALCLGRGNCCVEIPGQEPTHQVTGQDYREIPQSSNLCSGTLKRIMHQAR